ncbi:hypothetical protein EON82_00390 [bacterium]|nr:MAG: hypothetical protein EON82_00390 [bacterium]
MERELPRRLVVDRNSLVNLIEVAFRDVGLGRGTLWKEARALSGEDVRVETPVERRESALLRWTDVAEDPEWAPGHRLGAWSSLDPVGFRFYLPAAMLRCLRGGASLGVCHALTLPMYGDDEICHHRWSLLDEAQRACVRRFAEFMRDLAHENGDEGEREAWQDALDGYWNSAPTSA